MIVCGTGDSYFGRRFNKVWDQLAAVSAVDSRGSAEYRRCVREYLQRGLPAGAPEIFLRNFMTECANRPPPPPAT